MKLTFDMPVSATLVKQGKSKLRKLSANIQAVFLLGLPLSTQWG